MSSEAHARLGPSNARWPKCPGSIREEERYPDVSGEAAIDGTGSHLLLEMCLENSVPAATYDTQVIGVNHPDNLGGWMVDGERVRRVQMCLDYITRRVGELKQEYPNSVVSVSSESRADPGGAFGRDDWWGTCDITIIARNKFTGDVFFIEVADYKDGKVWVDVRDNTQLISYLFGQMRPYVGSGPDQVRPFNPEAVGKCRITIVQPKTNPVVRYDDVSVSEVISTAEDMAHAARLTDDPDAVLIDGSHCRWCKASPKRGGHCAAKTDRSVRSIDMEGSELSLLNKVVADPKSFSESQLAELADAEEGVVTAFEKVKDEIASRIEQGISVPGWAMKPGRSSRKWTEDEDTVAKKLKSRRLKKDEIYPSKLISVAQLMSLDSLTDDQKARIEKDMVANLAGKLKLTKVVAQTDTNVIQSATQMFSDVEPSFL